MLWPQPGRAILRFCGRVRHKLPDFATREERLPGVHAGVILSRMKLSAEELHGRAAEAHQALSACTLCGHRCGVARDAGGLGKCRCDVVARVATATLHPGEEPAISSRAGAIFFSRCNLRCVYCQNWQISQEGKGNEVSTLELADMMLRLRDEGAAYAEALAAADVKVACISVSSFKPVRIPASLLATIRTTT